MRTISAFFPWSATMNRQNPFPDALTRSELFVGIEQKHLSDIFGFGQRRVHPSGDTLFREGDPALMYYLVLKGRLKLSKLHEDGKEIIVHYVGDGGMMAAVAVLNGKNYPVTAQVVDTADVGGWDRETMVTLMMTYPRLAINMLHAVVGRLEDIQNRYLEIHAERVEQRIARAVLRMMKQFGRKNAEGILIDFRLSRQDLADYTGTTLYTVSRTLSHWEKEGWVSSGRERIVVTDPHALVLFSDEG
jgi:CRP-like cAMP-binding protein